MKPAPFELYRPDSLAAALALLEEHGEDARLLAGGQSLVPMMNLRIVSFSHLIDLNRVRSLSGIRREGETLRIGAMTRQQEIAGHPLVAAHAPLLAAALPYIGHVQTRSRGTVGGSLAHADPAAELPLVMVVLNAHFTLQSVAGKREVGARDFFQDMLCTDLAPGEVLTEIAVPMAPAGTRVSFREFARRHGDFAIAAAAAQYVDGPDGGSLAIGLGGVNPVPYFCARLSRSMAGGKAAQAAMEQLIREELEDIQPLSDTQADPDYRRTLAAILLADCLREVLQ